MSVGKAWQDWDANQLKARLAERLDPLDAPVRFDAARMQRDPLEYEPDYVNSLVDSAVLVPILDRPEGLTVLLTMRTTAMPSHAGQISFPGGRVHPEDEHYAATALREAHEEVGLPASHVRLFGKASMIVIGSGHKVTPIVGLVDPHGLELTPSPREVAEIFEVPFHHFLDPANYTEHSAEWQGRTRYYLRAPYEGRDIWGATAAMLWGLQRRLSNSFDE